GFEPGLSVLETDVLTVDTIPLLALPICDCRLPIEKPLNAKSAIENWQSAMPSLRFFVTCVLAATAAELTKLQTISRGLLVLCRNVVAALAFTALQHNVIPRHKLISPILPASYFVPLRLSFLCDFA